MTIRPDQIPEYAKSHSADLLIFAEAIDIFNSNIEPYVKKLLDQQLSIQSAWAAKQRVAPINILPKIIDKLTNIYQTTVMRQVREGNESDKNILQFYENETRMNEYMNTTNEYYNLIGATLLQPYVHKQKPFLRTIKNDKFFVISDDPTQPNVPTHVVLIYCHEGKTIFHVYTDEEIYIVGEDGKKRIDLMAKYGMDGTNPVGEIPFVYINSSLTDLYPEPDCDGLTILKLIPLMLSDLNHAAMFQCFSILYTINAGSEALQYSPNAVWELNQKPDSGSDQKPEIGQIKPVVDYDQVIKLITTILALWLETKGIKAGSIGNLTQDNFASGISKMIDLMDTFEARQKQVTTFIAAESRYWNLITQKLHPYWIANKMIQNVGLFSTNCQIKTTFAIQLPSQNRGEIVSDLKMEVEAGFMSRKQAIMRLNPELSDEQIEELIEEIDEENTIEVPNGMAANRPGDTTGSETQSEDTASGSGD